MLLVHNAQMVQRHARLLQFFNPVLLDSIKQLLQAAVLDAQHVSIPNRIILKELLIVNQV